LLRYPAWAGLFGTFIVLGVIYNTFPIYGNVDLELKKGTIGALLLARAVGNGAGYLVWGRTRFWQFRIAPSIGGLLVMVLLVLLLPAVRSLPLLVVVMTLMGPLNSFALSYSVFHAVTGSSQRSQRMAINEALLVSGIMIGSVMGGTVYQHFSMTMVSVVCAVLLTAAVAVQIPLFLRARRLEGRRFE
jgi:predicted MFS family arabinose efflux permease